MEKNVYVKPEIETFKMEGCQLLSGSEVIEKSDDKTGVILDEDGYYMAE